MKKGRAKKIPMPTTYTFRHPIPLFCESADCGAWALHALTKKPLKKIQKLSKDGDWPDKVMFKFLKKHGYKVTPVTIGNRVEVYSINDANTKPLFYSKHVLLVEQHCYKEENTWAVIYDNKIAHSGDVGDLNPLEFINYPLAAAYLITHKDWT